MCWKPPAYMAVATEDIITYKLVCHLKKDRYCSAVDMPCRDKNYTYPEHVWGIGDIIKMPKFKWDEYCLTAYGVNNINGIFSASYHFLPILCESNFAIMECLIPKGTKYYYCGIEEERNYCSEILHLKAIDLCSNMTFEEFHEKYHLQTV